MMKWWQPHQWIRQKSKVEKKNEKLNEFISFEMKKPVFSLFDMRMKFQNENSINA